MKVGDLVRKRDPWVQDTVGVVIKINAVQRRDGSWDTPTVRVWWPDGYGTFWTTSESLVIVSGK